MRKVFLYMALLLPALLYARKPETRNDDEFIIECTLDKDQLYEREVGVANITLLSPTPDVVNVLELSSLSLNKGSFASVSNVRVPDQVTRRRVRGREYFVVPLGCFAFSMDQKGKYELVDGEYAVDVAYPVLVRDPFWGNVRRSETKRYRIPVERKEFRVRELPGIGSSDHFSGAIGDFKVSTVVPPGDIIVNEEALAYIDISGEGVIPENVIPEYRNAFGGSVRLKSISENRNSYVRDGKLFSELRLECTFIPQERKNAAIGEVSFEFFNPSSGKYETVKSAPVEVEVKSSSVKRDSMDI